MMHKKAHKELAEDKQTKDMDYWNHVLWFDETKINLFGSEGVKRVRWQPGEEYKDKCVLPTVKRGGGSVIVWHLTLTYWSRARSLPSETGPQGSIPT